MGARLQLLLTPPLLGFEGNEQFTPHPNRIVNINPGASEAHSAMFCLGGGAGGDIWERLLLVKWGTGG